MTEWLNWTEHMYLSKAFHFSLLIKSRNSPSSHSSIFISETESRSIVSDSLWPHGLYSPWNSPGQNTGVGSLSFLQGIFAIQGSDPGLPHCRWQLSHKGSPRILEWVAYPFSSKSSQPTNQTGVSFFAGRFFTNWAIREAVDVAKYPFYKKKK